jgi:DNA repair protein RecO (recombination protein O)
VSSEKAEAIVIRLADFSESSKVATLFTRQFGRISGLAKGARRSRSAFEAALDLLSVCRVVFLRKSSGGLDLLTEAQLVKRFATESRQVGRYYGGYFVAELLAGLTEDYDPHPELFDSAVRTLDELQAGSDPEAALLAFELTVLREIGQAPAFDACVLCGVVVEDAAEFGLRFLQGGLVCGRCRGEYAGQRVSRETVPVLQQLSEFGSFSGSTEWSVRTRVELRAVIHTAISHALGRRPKMLSYLTFQVP